MCFTFDQGECRGASGRKLRRVCIYCPNFKQYRERKEKEDKENGNEGKDVH